jgi:hypothetical protein
MNTTQMATTVEMSCFDGSDAVGGRGEIPDIRQATKDPVLCSSLRRDLSQPRPFSTLVVQSLDITLLEPQFAMKIYGRR